MAENKGEVRGGRPSEEEGERGVGDANGAAGEFVDFTGRADFVGVNVADFIGRGDFSGVDVGGFAAREEREAERGDRNGGGEEEERERDRVEVAFANRAFRSGNENRNERRGEPERERGGEKARRGAGRGIVVLGNRRRSVNFRFKLRKNTGRNAIFRSFSEKRKNAKNAPFSSKNRREVDTNNALI